MSGLNEIKSKLQLFKRRFYVRRLVFGLLIFFILNSLIFLAFSSLENQFWLGVTGRSILFFSFLLFLLYTIYTLVVRPLLHLSNLRKGLSDEDAAKEISRCFPEIEDKLLNTLQLGSQLGNELIQAAIEKKSLEFNRFNFIQAVDFQPLKKYIALFSLIIVGFLMASFINPDLLLESPKRIANFQKEYLPKAPFNFDLQNESLLAYRGEDFILQVEIDGEQVPASVKILVDGDPKGKPVTLDEGLIEYTIPKIQEETSIQLEAAGFRSPTFTINVSDRPDLVSMIISIQEPNYTGGATSQIDNTGNISVREGSIVKWMAQTRASDSSVFTLNDKAIDVKPESRNHFSVEQQIISDGIYQIELFNAFSKNISDLTYSIEVIKDQYPEINADFILDSVTFSNLAFVGSIQDDYGFSGLYINYKRGDQRKKLKVPADLSDDASSQPFFANWSLDSLDLSSGEAIEVYISVFDNDGIHGPKETRSRTFTIKTPGKDEIASLVSDKQDQVEDDLNESQLKAEDIADRLEEIEERLKSEQKFDWQEKKLLNDILEDREELTEKINELEKQHKDLMQSSKKFQPQSQQLNEKNQQMQELLENLMDEETRELYEKLKQLMNENAPSDEITDQVNELKKNERNLERDLERALELFKRLKLESALEQSLQALDSLGTQQEELSEKPSDIASQEKLNEEFEDFRNKMDEIEKLNQELKRPEPMKDFELEERQISKELREILEQMKQESQNGEQQEGNNSQSDQKKQSSQSQQKQKNAAKKMQDLSKKLSNMQGGMQMEMMQANLDQLRDILDNLIKLSFNQEAIMTEMREVNQSDPRFLELSQEQLKLKDDAKIIQDSLLSLASKVAQISSFVTREVGEISENIDESLEFLKDRNRSRAITSQQFAMTSINNLALLLDDTMQQMQMAMSEAMGNSSQGEKSKPQGMPDLQELQNQLGEQINELQGSGKSGRQLSEELARLAAEQEMIRRQMELLKQAQDGKPGGGMGSDEMKRAIDMMEQNEIDLVNKRLTRQLINRQKQIMTRMLEAEKAQRNQELEEEREAQKPSIISNQMPPQFEKYLELKRKEIELLKTIPIQLNPFYKKEVNDYFRRLSSDTEND